MMQTPKKRNEPSILGRRPPSITTPARRKISLNGSESTSPHAVKTPTSRSPKVAEHKSPRSSVSKNSPVLEKKRPSKVSTLESQVSKLQEDLKRTKDLLEASESQRVRAQEAKEQKIEAQRQLQELSETEDARAQVLLQTTRLERDKAWQAEIEALREKQSADSAALSSAMSEVQMLRLQLESATTCLDTCRVKQVETDVEVQALREELMKTLAIVDSLKAGLVEFEKAEERYQLLVGETQVQLDVATGLINTLRSIRDSNSDQVVEVERPAGMELDSLQSEVDQLKAALDDAEKRYQEQLTKHELDIQSAHEELNLVKTQPSARESELEIMLRDAKVETDELRANLADKDAQLLGMMNNGTVEKLDSETRREGCRDSEPESRLETKHQIPTAAQVLDLKCRLTDKDVELKTVLEENERLKAGIESYESAIAERDLARSAEQEAVVKIGIVTEEADKSSRRAARISEQLEAVQAANSEMEAELRRLKIQSEQWRKAAEAAAAILSNGKNGEMIERSGSYNPSFNSLGGKLLNSPFSDDLDDDESPKKKSSNMFKKLGGMWKKGQK